MIQADFYSSAGEFLGECFCIDESPEEVTIIFVQSTQHPKSGYWLRNEDSFKIIAGEIFRGIGCICFTLRAPTLAEFMAFREHQWLLYSCYPKALLEQARLEGKNSSEKDFREKYARFFKPRYYGILNEKSCEEVVFELLGRKQSRPIESYHEAMECFNFENIPIVVHSKIKLVEGDTRVENHSTLLHKIDAEEFVVWTSYQCGSSDYIKLRAENWKNKYCVAFPLVQA